MSPVLPREERDAIRAKATGATKGDDPSYYAGTFVADVFTLLDAQDAAEAENERLRATYGLDRDDKHPCIRVEAYLRLKAERDAALAEVAALRGRIEGLATGIGDVIDRLLEDGTPEYAGVLVDLRALAADEGERTGR